MFYIAPEYRNLLLLCAGIIAIHLVFLYTLVNFYAADGIDFQTRIESQDSGQYIALAHSITQGDFARGGSPEVFRTPGYPVFAALILLLSGGSFWALLFAQTLLAAGIGVSVYFLGRALSLTHRLSLVLAMLAGLSSGAILTTLTGMGVDVLYTLLFTVAAFLLFHFERRPFLIALAIGLLLGTATLVRPIGLYASAPLFIAFFFLMPAQRSFMEKARILIVSVVMFCVVVVPWMMRNYALEGHFSLSSVSAYNIAYYNLPFFLSHKNSTTADEERARLLAPLSAVSDEELRGFASADALGEIVRDTLAEEGLVSYAVFHITQTASFFVSSGINVLHAIVTTGNEREGGAFVRIIILAERGAWMILFALAFVSPLFARGRVRMFLLLCIVLILANATLTSPIAQPRYRLPVEPLVFIAAGYAAAALVGRLRSRIQKPVVADATARL